MRDFILVFVAAFFSSLFTYAITDRAASAQPHTAAVISDEEHGAVAIVIDGKDIARFDGAGLHVDGLVTSKNSLVLPVVDEPSPVGLPRSGRAP